MKPAASIGKPRSGANDNKTAAKLVAPESDVERFYKERIETKDEASVSTTTLYHEYMTWCEEKGKEPLAHALFGKGISELGIQKAKVDKKTHYIGIAFKSGAGAEEDKKPPVSAKAA